MAQPLDSDGAPAPKLVSRFALFREPPVPVEPALKESTARFIERMTSGPGQRLGLLAALATSVTVTSDMTLVFIPGTEGVGVIVMGIRENGRLENWGSAAHLETILKGHPICTQGKRDGETLIIGLSPDGVAEQPITLADGSRINASVTRNVYAIRAPHPAGIQD
jgi:hypothetical protein